MRHLSTPAVLIIAATVYAVAGASAVDGIAADKKRAQPKPTQAPVQPTAAPATSHPPVGTVARGPLDLDALRCGDVEQIVEPVVSVQKYSFGGIRVHVEARNETDHPFNSRIGADVVVRVVETGVSLARYHTGYKSSVGTGMTTTLSYKNVPAPDHFMRWDRTDQAANPWLPDSECRQTIEVKVVLTLDPNLRLDGDPTNDDCSADNTKIVTLPFIAERLY